jgi:hypothetical protein
MYENPLNAAETESARRKRIERGESQEWQSIGHWALVITGMTQ